MIKGKRELLAKGLLWSGATFVFRHLPERDLLLVLNYHRIGNRHEDQFDSGIFSATSDELDEQISYLKRHVSLVTLEEALAFVEGTSTATGRRCRVLITFDDGYLDNYALAFPILRSHGVQAVFFLPTSMVGSCYVPWWDYIAYLMKTARQRRFHLRYPVDLVVDLDKDGLQESLGDILRVYYKSPGDTDFARFISELKEAAKGEEPPKTLRRFLNWDEAREMLGGGMAIGSHTHSHDVLSQLGPDRQRQELTQSRALLKQQLRIETDAIAYPVGDRDCFSEQTQLLAREAGYRAAFSYYGGTNMPGATPPFNVKRIGVGDRSWSRFRVQADVCRLTGHYWP